MPVPKPKIKYHVANDAERRVVEKEQDDPMSSMFIPLTERSETGKARWWANRAKAGRSKKSHAEFD